MSLFSKCVSVIPGQPQGHEVLLACCAYTWQTCYTRSYRCYTWLCGLAQIVLPVLALVLGARQIAAQNAFSGSMLMVRKWNLVIDTFPIEAVILLKRLTSDSLQGSSTCILACDCLHVAAQISSPLLGCSHQVGKCVMRTCLAKRETCRRN